MKKLQLQNAAACVLFLCTIPAISVAEQSLLKRLDDIEQRLQDVESESMAQQSAPAETGRVTNTGFNPAISVIFDGVYASYKSNPEDYRLPGYAPGGEAGLAAEGFSLGHSEISLSNNIDDKFFAKLTLAVAEHEGATEIELEEAFFETLALAEGFTLRGGRFYSALGYLNQQHQHAWDFQDAPLIYRGVFGDQYFDDGLRLSYLLPTDLFVELGGEVFAGGKYPAGGQHSGIGSWTAFVNLGGDIGVSHSWQSGLSYWSADNISREYSSHAHDAVSEDPLFEGDSHIIGLNAVYKWAPMGNPREQNIKLQFEYFAREDDGNLGLINSNPFETSTLDGQQRGWYTQAIWQFVRDWRAGIRYDRVDSENSGSDVAVLEEAGLLNNGHSPDRISLMTEWLPSEYSRIRFQYNRDDSSPVSDDQFFVQYTFSMGAHGAHTY